jgi:hypothetical protein
MSTRANLIENVITGEYGSAIFLVLVDENTDPMDISMYTGWQVILRSPDQLKTLTYTATLVSDGTDGKLYFTPAAATDIDRAGKWKGMIKLTATTLVTKSEIFDMIVIDSL